MKLIVLDYETNFVNNFLKKEYRERMLFDLSKEENRWLKVGKKIENIIEKIHEEEK